MTQDIIKITAPGSTMLLGEHAVLYGYPAIVCAIDKRIAVTLTPRTDQRVHIQSMSLGTYQTNLDCLEISAPFQFVSAAICHFKNQLEQGFDLEIHSEFSDKVGLGSSAAVTVATVAALCQLLTKNMDLSLVHQASIEIIRKVQGVGSGGDVLASVYGGILYYRSDSVKFEKLSARFPIGLVYSGHKLPTVEVIQKVQQVAREFPQIFSKLFLAIGECVESAKKAMQLGDFVRLGQVFKIHQGLQDALGVNQQILSDIINDSEQLTNVLGAKISGSGMGDCVLVLGQLPENYFPRNDLQKTEGVFQIPVKISNQGTMLAN